MAFSKRWTDACGLMPTETDSDRVSLLFKLYTAKVE